MANHTRRAKECLPRVPGTVQLRVDVRATLKDRLVEIAEREDLSLKRVVEDALATAVEHYFYA